MRVAEIDQREFSLDIWVALLAGSNAWATGGRRDEAWNRLPKYNRLTQPQREQALRDLYAAPLPTDKRFIKARAEDMERFQAEQWDEFVDKVTLRSVCTKQYSVLNDQLCHNSHYILISINLTSLNQVF